jgi:hypothetical protein
MKKLLALVLCVMMFVAILPTSAFADRELPNNPTSKAWPALSASKTAVENAQKNLDSIYGSLAANNYVFESVKSIDTFVSDLTKGLLKDVDNVKNPAGRIVSHDTLEDNAKAYLRGIIGNSINKEMYDNLADYVTINKAKDNHGNELLRYLVTGTTDTYRTLGFALNNGKTTTGLTIKGKTVPNTAANSDIYVGDDGYLYGLNPDGTWYYAKPNAGGTGWDPWQTMTSAGYANSAINYIPVYKYDYAAYAENWASAVSKALTSEKAVKGLEGVIYNLYVMKALDKASDDMDDFLTDVQNWDKDNKILKAYGFHGTGNVFDPYAFLNPTDLPKGIVLDNSLTKQGDMDWVWDDILD